MKKLIMLLGIMIVLTGCSKQTRFKTPPWSERQIEQIQDADYETVPIGIIRF